MPTWLIIVTTATVSYLLSLVVRVLTSREKKVRYRIEHLFSVGDDQFLRSMTSLLPPAALGANKITIIYWQGKIGRQFADALIERARAKVKVHVLLDWLGTKKMDLDSIQSMNGAGFEVHRYHPLRWYNIRRVNNRTHRKLLVVDGTVPVVPHGRRVLEIATLSGDWDHGRKYLVATNSLLAQGGHNYREFLRAANVKQGQAQYEMGKRWIKEHSPVMTPPLGRILRVG